MRVLPSGDTTSLIECANGFEASALAATLQGRVEITLGARTVLVRASRSQTLAMIATFDPGEHSSPARPDTQHHVISVRYDGPDLERVAGLVGLSSDEVIAAHTTTTVRVGFAGFAPGFAYLVDGDPRLEVPRLDVPRPRVPAGSVALASTYSGIYPRESAGGWLIIGHTSDWLWDIDRTIPARFAPGDSVTFLAI